MKKRILSIMTVIMAVIFLCGTLSVMAYPSNEKVNKDYRHMSIQNAAGTVFGKQGGKRRCCGYCGKLHGI